MRCSVLPMLCSIALVISLSPRTRGEDPPPETRSFRLPFRQAAPDLGGRDVKLPSPPRAPFSGSPGDWSRVSRERFSSPTFVAPDPGGPLIVGGRRVPSGDLTSLLERLVAPFTWNDRPFDFGLELEGSTLEATHRPAVLDELGRLLRQLEAGAPRSVRMEVARIPLEALDAAAPGWRDDESSPWLPSDALHRAVAEAGPQARYISWTAASGERKVSSPPRHHGGLTDYEVNQTGVLPVVNPVTSELPDGLHVDARPFVSPGGAWVRIDLRVGDSRYLAGERRRLPYGELELPRGTRSELATSLVSPAGRTVLAGLFEEEEAPDDGEAVRGFAVLARARPAPRQSEESATDQTTGRFAAVDIGCLLAPFELPFPGSDSAGHVVVDGEGNRPSPLDSRTVIELLVARGLIEDAGSVRFLGHLAVVRLGESDAQALRRSLGELARDTLRAVTVEVTRRRLPVSAALELIQRNDQNGQEANDAPPDTAGKDPNGTITHRARLTMVARFGGWLAGLRHRSYVADLEKVTGGVESEIIQTSDPVVRSAGEGIIVTLSLGNVSREKKPAGDEHTVIPLRLEGEILGRPAFPRRAHVLANDQEAETIYDPRHSLELDLPRESIEPLRAELAAPLGRTIVLEVGPDEITPQDREAPQEEAPESAENPSTFHRTLTVRVRAADLPDEE